MKLTLSHSTVVCNRFVRKYTLLIMRNPLSHALLDAFDAYQGIFP